MPKPFEQGRFEDLPERPRVPHRYYDADTSTVAVASQPFGDVRVYVVAYGPRDAPPLLLVHGLMTTSYSWRYLFSTPLAERFRLIAPDLPGSGRSDLVPERQQTVRALATFLGELQDALGIGGCHAIANSLGGLVALRRALDAPRSFASLLAIHPPAVVEPRLVALHAGLRIPGARAVLEHVIRRDPLRWAHGQVHYYDETLKSLEEAHEYGDPLASAAGARAFTNTLRDALDPGPLHRLDRELERRRDHGEQFPAPLMLLYAAQDPTVPPKIGAKLAKLIPSADFRRLERSSHFAQVDRPDQVAAFAAELIDATATATAP